jgi:hypothetical protein
LRVHVVFVLTAWVLAPLAFLYREHGSGEFGGVYVPKLPDGRSD